MDIAGRIRYFREFKHLSQGDLENRTGLKRCYISRVEHGHTVPSVETLQRIAAGLEAPLYQLLYDGNEVSQPAFNPSNKDNDWASKRTGRRLFQKLRLAISQMSEKDRKILLFTASQLASNGRH